MIIRIQERMASIGTLIISWRSTNKKDSSKLILPGTLIRTFHSQWEIKCTKATLSCSLLIIIFHSEDKCWIAVCLTISSGEFGLYPYSQKINSWTLVFSIMTLLTLDVICLILSKILLKRLMKKIRLNKLFLKKVNLVWVVISEIKNWIIMYIIMMAK